MRTETLQSLPAMDSGTRDTSENDMSYEYTGPAIVVPSNRSPKRDFSAFSNDEYSRPTEQTNRPAFSGNAINQQSPTIHNHHPDRIQHQDAPSYVHWGIYRTLEAVHFTCAMLQAVYAATVMAAVAVAPAKRRLVSFTQEHPVPAPIRRMLWPRRSVPHIFRQIQCAPNGHCSTRPIAPPKFKPAASSPFHVPGRFPVSPIMSPSNTPATPINLTSTISGDVAESPASEPTDGRILQECHMGESVSLKDGSIDETASLASEPSDETMSWRYTCPSTPQISHASVRELQGIREMFCRTSEKEGQAATRLIKSKCSPSPVPASEGEASSPAPTSTLISSKGHAELTRPSSSVSVAQEETNSSLKSSRVTAADRSMGSTQTSPPTSAIQGEARMSLESSAPTFRGGLIESPPSSPPTSGMQREVHTPLKNPMPKSGHLVKTKLARSPPSKGWIHQLVSSVKMKKRASPLGEIYNKANERQIRTSKNARFSENPVSATKRFIKNETISYPSPISSRDENSILSSASSLNILHMSPTQQEQDVMIADQLMCSTPGMIGYSTDSVCEPNTSLSSDEKYNCPGKPDSQSNDGSESDQNLPTINEIDGQTKTANHDCSASPASQCDSDASSHDSLPKSDFSSQASATPAKLRDVNPTTPPSKLSEAFDSLTVSGRRSSRRTHEKQKLIEKRRAEQEAIAAELKARKEKAEAEEKARREAEAELERQKYARRMPVEKVIQPLTEIWENNVTAALAHVPSKPVARTIKGTEILRRDIGFVLPQHGTKDDQRGYLNDAIIEAYLLAVVDRGNRVAGHKRGEAPRMHAFNNFFYDNLKEHGPERVKRWASKAKIGGKDLLKADWIFVPICENLHWTLVVVSGTRKTIEYFDSLNMHVMGRIDIIKKWLKNELGSGYQDDAWKIVEDLKFPGRGKGPHQNNGSDCGVFVITTAKMISLGVDPMAVLPTDMVMQRRRLVAELINGGFTDDFEPKIVFE